jgi:HEPN domain-containing protein
MKKESFDKITRYWIEHASYDLVTAKAMLKTRRYLYVTFMCQQAAEKMLKAVITLRIKIAPPRIHDLSKLAAAAKIKHSLSQSQKDFLAELTPFCIITRYAGYKKKLSELSNAKLAKATLAATEDFIQWVKNNLIFAK